MWIVPKYICQLLAWASLGTMQSIKLAERWDVLKTKM